MELFSFIFTLANSHFIYKQTCICICVCVCVVNHILLCSLPGSSVHGIYQARMLEWVAICYSRGSSQPRHWTCSLVFPALAAEFLPLVPPGKHIYIYMHTHTHTYIYLSVLYLFAFSYCSWCSQGKNTEVVCHFHLQWTLFCPNTLPWPVCLGWPYKAWLIVSLS